MIFVVFMAVAILAGCQSNAEISKPGQKAIGNQNSITPIASPSNVPGAIIAHPVPSAVLKAPPIAWNVTWGTNYNVAFGTWGDGMRLYTTGYQDDGASGYDLNLIAWNPGTGTRLWNVTWGGAGTDAGTAVWGDGKRVYTAGYTTSYGALNYDLLLIAWNETTGTRIWNETWGGPLNEFAYGVWGDGIRIYTAGQTNSFGVGGYDFAVVAWDPATGHRLWTSEWGGPLSEGANAVWGDGTRLFTAGWTASFGVGSNDFALVAWDPATGARLWNATWGGVATDTATAVWGDGNRIYTAGLTYSYGSGGDDFAVVAWDPSAGTRLWVSTWGGASQDEAFGLWGDGTRLYTVGRTYSFGAGNSDVAVVAWNPINGAFLYSTTWGTPLDDAAYCTWGDGTQLYTAGSTNTGGPPGTVLLLIAWDIHFTVTTPGHVAYAEGTTGHTITWLVSCATVNAGPYTVFCNGLPFASGTWVSGQDIIVPVDNFTAGTYNFVIVAADGFGAQVASKVMVTVSTATTWGLLDSMAAVAIVLLAVILIMLVRATLAKPARKSKKLSAVT
ncbi:MAG TPA: hypothetical protein VKM55_29975 [Candidatus Lokiarchaeia archaeon]|nr:hypothetical protein [Candidatus Lokiarchaeia archaeon]